LSSAKTALGRGLEAEVGVDGGRNVGALISLMKPAASTGVSCRMWKKLTIHYTSRD